MHDTGIDSGLYDNVFANGSPGTENIQDISTLPQYEWNKGWQPDDYGWADDVTPTTLTE